MNNKIKNIVKFNLYKNIQNKWFIILNIFMLLITVVSINFNEFKSIIKIDKNKDKFNINIYDESNLLYGKLNNELSNNEKLKNKLNLKKLDNENSLNELKNDLTNNDVIVEINNDFNNIKVISKEGIDNSYYQFIYDNIKVIKKQDYAIKHNISINDLDEILKEPSIERIMLNVNSKDSKLKRFLNHASNYMIFLILMIILSKIANDISQEKMSKSIEYVLTSINEKDYLISKVISINLTVIVQTIFAFVYFVIANGINRIININTLENISNNILNYNVNIDSTILIYIFALIIISVLTIIMLTTIQAAISSKTTNVSEASNATFLLVMINMVIYFIASFLITPLKTPNIVMYIVSCIPIVSMYFIPSMIIVGNYNLIIVPIAIIINAIAVPYVFKVCSKIFKNGVLNHNNTKKKENDENIEEKINKKMIKNNYKNIAFVSAMAIILFVLSNNILGLILGVIMPKIKFISSNTLNIITQMIIFVLSLYIPIKFLSMYNNNKEKPKKYSRKIILKDLSMGLTLIIITQVICSLIPNLFGIENKIDKLFKVTNNFEKVLFFIQVAVLPAIFEELFVRKELLNLSKKISNKFAIVFTSIVFALIHLNLSQSLFAFFVGLILASIAIKYNSIKLTSFMHLLNNGVAALFLIFENNKVIMNIIIFILAIVFCIGIKNIVSLIINRIKENKKIDIKLNKDVKYLFLDYTFIITCIFMIVLFILTELILKRI